MVLDRRAFLGKAAASLIATQISPILLSQSETAGHLTLPPWEPGYLYIHHISTGRGSCALLILPDATTMMIDAGSIISGLDPQADKFFIDPRPNASMRPGQWIARYTRECLSQAGRDEIDYFLLTHFHEDHFGTVWPGKYDISPRSKFGPSMLPGEVKPTAVPSSPERPPFEHFSGPGEVVRSHRPVIVGPVLELKRIHGLVDLDRQLTRPQHISFLVPRQASRYRCPHRRRRRRQPSRIPCFSPLLLSPM
jgi:hypothetical protein